MASVAAKLEKHMDGVSMLLESLKDTPHFPEWHESHFNHVLGMIEVASLQFKEAARLVHKVKGMPFFESEKMKLLEALEHSCTNAAVVAVDNASGKMQDYTKIHAYFADRHWAMAFDSSKDEMQKLDLFTELAASLGLRCASEPTQAMLLTLSLLSSKEYTPAVKHEMFKAAKKRIKAVCNQAVASPTLPYILQLPGQPDRMDRSWMAHAFPGMEEKVAKQQPKSWSAMRAQQLYLSIPQRSSNKMSQPASMSMMVPSANVSMTPGNPMVQMLQFMQMMQGMQGHLQQETDIQILQNRKRPLQLEDVPETPAPKAARVGLISPASGAKEVPVLQLDGDEVKPEKPLQLEKAAGSSKSPLAVAAILREQLEERKAAKKAEDAAKKAEQAAAKAAEKQAEKEAKNAAKAAEQQAEKEKKDAAKAAGAPAASGKADKWEGLPSEAERHAARPTGCSKCRFKIGCTPSCWRKK